MGWLPKKLRWLQCLYGKRINNFGVAYLNRLKNITDGSDKGEELDQNHLSLQLNDSDNYSAIDEDVVDKECLIFLLHSTVLSLDRKHQFQLGQVVSGKALASFCDTNENCSDELCASHAVIMTEATV